MMLQRKGGAIELSMTTMIVVVLSLTMLILGFVFVRSIMCGAIGVTDEIGNKVEGEVQRLFESSSADIACIGSDNPIPMIPGANVISCAITAKSEGIHTVRFVSITSTSRELDGVNLETWVRQESRVTEFLRAPGDETRAKTIRIIIPEDAPEGSFAVKIKALRPDGSIMTGVKDLDFRVTRTGVVRNVLC